MPITTIATPSAPSGSATSSQLELFPLARSTSDPSPLPEKTLERREKYKEKWGNGNGFGLTLGQAAAFCASGWTTPQAHDVHPRGAGNRQNPNGGMACLAWDARLAGWPTPVGNDDNKSVEAHLAMKARMGGNRTAITSLQVMAQTAGWATPTSRDHKDAASTLENTPVNSLLGRQVQVAGWGTPRSTDAEKNVRTPEGAAKEIARKGAQNDLGLVSGLAPSGSPASTARRGALNPRFSLWLQGYPTEWASCGEAVTLSRPKRPPSSSKP